MATREELEEMVRINRGRNLLARWEQRLERLIEAREMFEAWCGSTVDDTEETDRLQAHLGLPQVIQFLGTMTTTALQNVQRLQEFAEVKGEKKKKS